MATISDVATHAGVSMKTVSRVLNNEAHVRPALKARVEEAVRALGYRPNLAARQLAGNRSFVIAYPFNNPSPSYITDSLMGAARACRDRGYHLVSEPVDDLADALQVIDHLMRTLRPDGFILVPPLSDDPRLAARIEEHGAALVRIASPSDIYGQSLILDDKEVSRALVAHLIEHGHRRIGFVKPPPNHLLAQARYDGYLGALADAGLEVCAELVRDGAFDLASGVSAGRGLLDLSDRPTAIFAANDDMALGVMQVAHERGLKIPVDLAIAGFDDSPASRIAWPPLTTVRQPTNELARIAALQIIGEAPDTAKLRHELLIRGSTTTLKR